MVMIFNSEKARGSLLENGVVFTFRARRRKRVGDDWITDKRGHPKIADVFIEEVGNVDPYALGVSVEYSGFESLKEWFDEIKRLNKGTLPQKGWLYKVSTSIRGFEEADGR